MLLQRRASVTAPVGSLRASSWPRRHAVRACDPGRRLSRGYGERGPGRRILVVVVVVVVAAVVVGRRLPEALLHAVAAALAPARGRLQRVHERAADDAHLLHRLGVHPAAQDEEEEAQEGGHGVEVRVAQRVGVALVERLRDAPQPPPVQHVDPQPVEAHVHVPGGVRGRAAQHLHGLLHDLQQLLLHLVGDAAPLQRLQPEDDVQPPRLRRVGEVARRLQEGGEGRHRPQGRRRRGGGGGGGGGRPFSPPRLLVPAVLVMGAFRWNKLHVDDVDAMHFEILQLLLGFFTYKIASVVEVGATVYADLSGERATDAEKDD
mmetsp:Transcript_7655/g.28191  ORF Transcript_7655/g.28191 Transcript_7655/m.28191 type:complete len:319 (-) Transcript_7655:140-1096(-)